MQDLTDKHVLITGGGTGIGSAIARELGAAGANITVLGRRLPPLEEVIEGMGQNSAGGVQQGLAISCDITDTEALDKAFEQAAARFGTVDILVNCAGAAPTAPFHKISEQQWRDVMALNLDAVFHCSQRALDPMLAQGWGRIINIASTAAQRGYAYVSAYCAAKHGVLGMTRALALETARKGITVNAICPGYTDTDIIRNSVAMIVEKTGRSEEQALEQFTATNPQGRLIQPEEVAATVLWLCQANSASMTGQAISVSGGEVM